MSKKNKKTTVKYTPDNAPINYSETSDIENASTASDVSEVKVNDSNVIESVDSDESSEDGTSEEAESQSLTDEAKTTFTKSFLTNLIKVKIVGKKNANGYHMMYPNAIANAVVDGSGRYMVLTSSQTAKSICNIIREGTELHRQDLSAETREIIISRFLADLKRYQF